MDFGTPVAIAVHPTSQVIAQGSRAVLEVLLVDAEGQQATPEAAGIEWHVELDSEASAVAVDGGSLRARAYGMEVFTVRAGELQSQALSVVVADLNDGVIEVPADAVLALTNPREKDGHIRYEAEIQDVELKAGDQVFGQGDTMLMGEVIGLNDDADGEAGVYTIAYRGPGQIFEHLEVKRSFDLQRFPKVLDAELAAAYKLVERDDGFFVLETRAASQKDAGPIGATQQRLGTSTKLGPFTCKTEAGLKFSPLTSVSAGAKTQLDFHIDYSLDTGLKKLMMTGDVTADAAIKPRLAANVEGAAFCEATVFTIKIPMGPLAWIMFGRVPIGVGAKIAAKVSSPEYGYDIAMKGGVKDIAMGLDCASDCSLKNDFSLFLDPPSTKLVYGDAASTGAYTHELSGEVYGFAKIGLGIGLWALAEAISSDFVSIQAGTKFAATWMTMEDEFDNPNFASGYLLSQTHKIAVEPKLSFLDGLISLSLFKVEAKNEIALASSPTGTFTISPKRVNREGTLTLSVDLKDVDFLSVDNVNTVEFYRKSDSAYLYVGEATPNGMTAELEWTLSEDVEWQGEASFYAAVVPNLMADFGPFEVASNSAQQVKFASVNRVTVNHGDFDAGRTQDQAITCAITTSVDVGANAEPIDLAVDKMTWHARALGDFAVIAASGGAAAGITGEDGLATITLQRTPTTPLQGPYEVEFTLTEDGASTSETVTVQITEAPIVAVIKRRGTFGQVGTSAPASLEWVIQREVDPGIAAQPLAGVRWRATAQSPLGILGVHQGTTDETGQIGLQVALSTNPDASSYPIEFHLEEGSTSPARPASTVSVEVPTIDPGGGGCDNNCCGVICADIDPTNPCCAA